MQRLSRAEIEFLADRALGAFQKGQQKGLSPTDIFGFAAGHLRLKLEYATLSTDCSILGMTSFSDTVCEIYQDDELMLFTLPKGYIVIEKSLHADWHKGRERFTIAHECAHQLLHTAHALEFRQCRAVEYAETLCAQRRLSTTGDWLEWQANVMAAALLMPGYQMVTAMNTYFKAGRLQAKYGEISVAELKILTEIAELYGVSVSALIVRLKQLNLLTGMDKLRTRNQMDVIVEEEYCA